MSKQPIGKLDHIGIAVKSIAEARKFYEGMLGLRPIARPDFGIGMTKPEVAELSAKIDIAALRDYRDAVGRRTREIVGGFGPGDWKGEIEASAVEKAAALGCFGTRAEGMVKAFAGRARSAVVPAILIMHSAGHMGEAATVRTTGGFGSGV